MSTEWEVIVFDKEGTDRSLVRPAHVAAIPEAVNKGIVNSAGAIYTDASKSKFAGSAFHIIADSKEEIIEFLKQDVYYKEGIWDINSVIAYPLGVAVRLPKKMDGVNKF
ncbi:uncharacterized protein PRCAT00000695001 [Priceomyces carsonii]|uniref:uncharacterized protein n=1 Tax=Priceomyces carsonii TaxID=28549 RepID=UPI002EDB15DD|nr:unnamed protein product [Priceomyces carsonii]